MKDKKVAKYMKKLAKSAYEDIMNMPSESAFMQPHQEEDFLNLMMVLYSAKCLFKWHTTEDRWHEVDKYSFDVEIYDQSFEVTV